MKLNRSPASIPENPHIHQGLKRHGEVVHFKPRSAKHPAGLDHVQELVVEEYRRIFNYLNSLPPVSTTHPFDNPNGMLQGGYREVINGIFPNDYEVISCDPEQIEFLHNGNTSYIIGIFGAGILFREIIEIINTQMREKELSTDLIRTIKADEKTLTIEVHLADENTFSIPYKKSSSQIHSQI